MGCRAKSTGGHIVSTVAMTIICNSKVMSKDGVKAEGLKESIHKPCYIYQIPSAAASGILSLLQTAASPCCHLWLASLVLLLLTTCTVAKA